jgi:hypothetical protein
MAAAETYLSGQGQISVPLGNHSMHVWDISKKLITYTKPNLLLMTYLRETWGFYFISYIFRIILTKNYRWVERKAAINHILEKVDLTTSELNRYTFWDLEKAYTRNLISTDNVNYSLLLLCWNPGKESKIHYHPCDGCFIKTMRGCIRETSMLKLAHRPICISLK